MKILKLMASLIISTAMLFALHFSAGAETVGAFEVTGGVLNTDYTYADNVLTIISPTPVTISGTTTTDRIEVADGVSANITLAGVNIDLSATSGGFDSITGLPAVKIADNSTGNVTITLADGTTNTLKSGYDCAGLQKSGAYISETEGKLTIQGGELGTGILDVTGGSFYGAGIGGNANNDGSNITISGGVIKATGDGAGIGGGLDGNGTHITISGGTVTVTGGMNAAGIGGSYNGNGTDITISGGIVNVQGGYCSAGIGGGRNVGAGGGECDNIVISGGTVTVTGGADDFGNNGPAIGGSGGEYGGSCGTVSITGGVIIASGGDKNTADYTLAQNAIILDADDGTATVYGNPVITDDFTLPEGYTLVIPEGSTVTVAEGATFTNNGTVTNNGTLENNGTVTNSGDIVNNGTVEDNGEIIGDQPYTEAGDFTVTGGTKGTDYTYEDGVLTIKTATPITIANKTPENATTNRIEVEADTDANITLAGVNIDQSATGSALAGDDGFPALKIADDSTGDVTITLADDTTNTLKSGMNCAGLQKNGNADGIGTLTIKGEGSLTAIGLYGAGIGGGYDSASSNIAISSGTVTATGDTACAGIGGGRGKTSSNITISGGTVTATGGISGAGIGGGYYSAGSDITISGGIVYVTAGSNANSIGGGYGKDAADLSGTQDAIIVDNTAKTITVYGDVTLTEDFEVPAGYTMTIPEGATLTVGTDVTLTNNGTIINNGTLANNGTVINSGTVENKGAITGNAVGGTVNTYDFVITGGTEGEDYTYTGGVLTVIKNGATLTIANKTPLTPTTNRIEVADDVSADITLAGVNIDVFTQSRTAAFKIAYSSSGNVTITLADGTTNTLKSGEKCAGLQKNGTLGYLEINGTTGKLIATGGYGGAGIGGSGTDPTCYNITINGGNITATGGNYAAGIGGGDSGSGTNIKINGGTVIATGSYAGAGIGGGIYGNGTDITINGGTVTAIGGSNNSGIGDFRNSSSNIIINGGSVNASSIGCTPTNGTDDVYLLTIANPNGKTVTIDGTEYTPTNHTAADPADTNLYVYLPAKTAQSPNEVTVGNETTKYCYDTANAKWLIIVDAPEADNRDFTYNGEEQTYALTESDCYTISGNNQTNAGDHTVTVALNDGYIWSDGTADDKEYTFTIAKADPVVTVTTDKPSDIAGKTITVTATAKHPTNAALTDVPTVTLTYKVGENGAETEFDGSFAIPEGTANGTEIIITAKTAASNNYNAATATAKVIVTDCEHADKATVWTTDGTSHWHVCGYCGAEVDKAEHSGGTANCMNKAVCSVCSTPYGEKDSANHANKATEWTSDSTGHWHVCDCGKVDFAAHVSSGAATETTAENCTICGYVIAPATGHINHTPDTTKWLYDSTSHWQKCIGCEEKLNVEAHVSSGAATETTAETCTICGYVMSPASSSPDEPNIPIVPPSSDRPGWGAAENSSAATTTTTTEAVTESPEDEEPEDDIDDIEDDIDDVEDDVEDADSDVETDEDTDTTSPADDSENDDPDGESNSDKSEETESDIDGEEIGENENDVISDEADPNPETGVAICFGCVIVSAMTVMITRKRKNK